MLYIFVLLMLIGSIFLYAFVRYTPDGKTVSRRLPWGFPVTGVVVFTLLTIIQTVFIVEPGTVGFVQTFGTLSHTVYEEGLHFKSPFGSVITSNIRRNSVNYTGDDTAQGLTRNRVVLLVDVTVPWILNPAGAPLMYERYGVKWNLIEPASRSAIRDCTSQLDWENAVGEEGRNLMADCIPLRTSERITADLIQAGFTEEQAHMVFTFPVALIREILPKDERILAAIAEEQAAIINLRRQETLTEIAQVEAERRATEGTGIRRMMEELDGLNYTVAEMVALIAANNGKTNAEAFQLAVENGNPNITIITGGNVPVTVPTN